MNYGFALTVWKGFGRVRGVCGPEQGMNAQTRGMLVAKACDHMEMGVAKSAPFIGGQICWCDERTLSTRCCRRQVRSKGWGQSLCPVEALLQEEGQGGVIAAFAQNGVGGQGQVRANFAPQMHEAQPAGMGGGQAGKVAAQVPPNWAGRGAG